VMKQRLVEQVRPSLPAIRNTPYGRRIQAKIQSYDIRSITNPASLDQRTETDSTQGQMPLRPPTSRFQSTSTVLPSVLQNGGLNGLNGVGHLPQYPTSETLTVSPPEAESRRPVMMPLARPAVSMPMPAESGEAPTFF
jgi:hypothetical protein